MHLESGSMHGMAHCGVKIDSVQLFINMLPSTGHVAILAKCPTNRITILSWTSGARQKFQMAPHSMRETLRPGQGTLPGLHSRLEHQHICRMRDIEYRRTRQSKYRKGPCRLGGGAQRLARRCSPPGCVWGIFPMSGLTWQRFAFQSLVEVMRGVSCSFASACALPRAVYLRGRLAVV